MFGVNRTWTDHFGANRDDRSLLGEGGHPDEKREGNTALRRWGPRDLTYAESVSGAYELDDCLTCRDRNQRIVTSHPK